jgi:hypothetical protein
MEIENWKPATARAEGDGNNHHYLLTEIKNWKPATARAEGDGNNHHYLLTETKNWKPVTARAEGDGNTPNTPKLTSENQELEALVNLSTCQLLNYPGTRNGARGANLSFLPFFGYLCHPKN